MISIDFVRTGEKVKIVDIKGGKGIITKISAMGIRIGDTVEVIQNHHGPLIIAKDHIRIALGRGMSKKILVEKVKGDNNG